MTIRHVMSHIPPTIGILGLLVAMFLLPTESWTTLSISDALAADGQLASAADWDSISEPCIETIKSAEALYAPRGPMPEPGPLVVGCKLSDCGPGTDGPGPIDLRITLTGELAEKAMLEFENMTVREATHIAARGNVKHVKGTTRFQVQSGNSVLRGFGNDPKRRPPVATPHLILNRKAFEAFKRAAKVDDLLAKIKSPVTLEIEQFRGAVVVNRFALIDTFKSCRSITPRPQIPLETPSKLTKLLGEPGPGKPNLNPAKGHLKPTKPLLELPKPPQHDFVRLINLDLASKFMILAPGRINPGVSDCADYPNEVYQSSAGDVVEVRNHLNDEETPKVMAHLGSSGMVAHHPPSFPGRCHSEVVVYSESHALAVVRPVIPPWTDAHSETVSVELQPPLKIPVTIWILLPDPTMSHKTRLQDNLHLATSIYTHLPNPPNPILNGMCGIIFDEDVRINSVNSQLPVGQEVDYLRIASVVQGETIMKAGCGTPGSTPCFYDPGRLNVYLVEYADGNLGSTSYSPTRDTCNVEHLPTCDFFGDMIFLAEDWGDDTLAHEFGHTFELDGTTGVGGMTNTNLMWEYGRAPMPTSITKGQCYRAHVDHFSYVNTGGIRPSTSPTHGNCPRNGAQSERCPGLSFVGP